MSDDKTIWDDTLLIKAYDNSVNLARETLARRIADSTNRREECEADNTEGKIEEPEFSENPVKVGDFVRATYLEDGLDYEGTIISINEEAASCIVRYLGYENEQEVLLSELLPSWGSKARRAQIEEADKQPDEQQKPETHRAKSSKKSTSQESKRATVSSHDRLLMPPMPPVPPMFGPGGGVNGEPDQDFVAMLTAWYMSGYYTGLYQGKKESSAKKKKPSKK